VTVRNVGDPAVEARAAPAIIASVVEKKARKYYSPSPHLVVYVNLWLIRALTAEDLATLGEVTAPWRDRFPEIWLLWKQNVVRCQPSLLHFVPRSLPRGVFG
jgi:hypothetical protein